VLNKHYGRCLNADVEKQLEYEKQNIVQVMKTIALIDPSFIIVGLCLLIY